ncbi:MAG: hypothetical protein H6745_07965 [Deltaproteobacteria bacterium]|nr:hypothetical protein [Deltaproteobacteria bacterium]
MLRAAIVAATALASALGACASAPSAPSGAEGGHAVGHLVAPPAGSDVWTWVSGPWAFETSTYFIEGPTGLVVIDTQFLPSEIARAVDAVEARTGKKAALAVVLHANPDKFNGTATLQARGVKVVTSRQVAELIPEVHELRKSWFYARYKPDYPEDAARPEVFGDATTDVEAGGVSVRLHVLGRAAAARTSWRSTAATSSSGTWSRAASTAGSSSGSSTSGGGGSTRSRR